MQHIQCDSIGCSSGRQQDVNIGVVGGRLPSAEVFSGHWVFSGFSLGGRLPLLQCSARARWKEKPRVWREFQPSLSSLPSQLLSRPVNWITVRFGIVYFSCEERHGVWPGIYMSNMILHAIGCSLAFYTPFLQFSMELEWCLLWCNMLWFRLVKH